MLGQKVNVDGNLLVEKESKTRKRGCSSSSSSSLARHYRLKRAVLVRKIGGSTTPVPTWKMGSPKSFRENAAKISECSARKLGATLWEIKDLGSPKEDSERKQGLVAERKERLKDANHRRRTSVDSQLEGLVTNYNADKIGVLVLVLLMLFYWRNFITTKSKRKKKCS